MRGESGRDRERGEFGRDRVQPSPRHSHTLLLKYREQVAVCVALSIAVYSPQEPDYSCVCDTGVQDLDHTHTQS